jgi:two-component system, cell cycle response regulator
MTAKTVLVVDDSRATRAFIRRALEQAGYRTIEAADGEEALAWVDEQAPDAILLDVDMPGLDGFQTLERLNTRPDAAKIPVIFLTAHSAAEDAVAGLVLGAQDDIRKPCAPEELVARVRTIMALKARHDELHEQLQEVTRLSTTDSLTGLPNRRRLDEILAAAGQSPVGRHPLSVAVIDIDHFKQVNDREGHAIGDAVLRTVALRLLSVVRDNGHLGRWGGEEFLCVLPGLDAEAAMRLAEAMRAAVCAEPVPVTESSGLSITVSIGVATGIGVDAQRLMVDADAALYQAKGTGRNRVVFANKSGVSVVDIGL